MSTDTTIDSGATASNTGLWATAIFSFIIGTALTCYTIGLGNDMSPALQRKVSDLEHLRAMQIDLRSGLDAVAAFAASASGKPAPLAEIMKDTIEGIKADDIKDVRRDTVPGWAVRQKELAFGEVPLDRIMAFISKAENQRPPWCLARCVIRASPRTAGAARVELTLEAVEKLQ